MSEQSDRPDIGSLRIDPRKKNSDRPRSKAWGYVLVAALLVIVVVAYFLFKDTITPAMKVKVDRVTRITGTESQASLVATGYVVAQRKAEVASKGTGRLEYLGFEEGDTVLAGEVIARLDNDDIAAGLDQARANLKAAQADSISALRSFNRASGLHSSASISDQQFEDAETAYMQANAACAAAAAAVRAAEVQLENTYIRAPFDGTVLSKNADVGEIVAPFASSASSKGSVVTLADMNSLEVEADVSESNIQKVIVGQPCEIILDAYPDVHYEGYVKKIVPTADRSRATVLTKVAFTQKDDRVLPEMSARVNFFLHTPDESQPDAEVVLAVPKDAITTRNDRKIVFAIDGELVREQPIDVGRELGSMVEVTRGVSEGQQVVLSPPGKLTGGQKVEITY